MAITDSLILPEDVVLMPVADLPDAVREQISYDDGDYALTRPRSRTPSSIIDAQAAVLLERFRKPATVIEAVLHFSQAQKANPEETLENAFPLIQRLLNARLLVPVGSDDAGQIAASFEPGEQVADWDVLNCVQVLEDTELYQVRRGEGGEAALKILRPTATQTAAGSLRREAAILKHLDGSVSPRLLDEGQWEGRGYVVMEWCPGVPASAAAHGLRQGTAVEWPALHRLCGSLLAAYVRLHAQGVVHSDVHPRNVLVADDGQVKIIDFGWARLDGDAGGLGHADRAGVGFFYEPELAQAQREGRRPPLSTFAGEQYALGALLYLLLTGEHYLDFSVEKQEMLRQIVEDSLQPFVARRHAPWPAVETLLGRALHKNPAERFPSVAEWAARWEEASAPSAPPARDTPAPGNLPSLTRWLDQALARVGPQGPLLATGLTIAPYCSINNGAAGIAYALYRIAMARGEAALLSSADLWATKAWRAAGHAGAFDNPDLELTAEVVGPVTPYHTLSGVHAVRVLVGLAMGDFVSAQQALDAFIRAVQAPCDNLDITLGRSGVLLACALLLEALPDSSLLDRRPLEALGDETMAGIWAETETFPAIPECRELSFLGIAHGWAGLMYAAMRWHGAAGRPVPAALPMRLAQLAACAEPCGPGARWKRKVESSGTDYWSGWCNGTAGFVHLWTLAHRALGNDSHLRLAEQAAWHSWQAKESIGDLCCGQAGRAYGLLALYRHTGETAWLRRAQDLTAQATRHIGGALLHDSLYKGEVGVALLVADLACPETAAMPFFEPEGGSVN